MVQVVIYYDAPTLTNECLKAMLDRTLIPDEFGMALKTMQAVCYLFILMLHVVFSLSIRFALR